MRAALLAILLLAAPAAFSQTVTKTITADPVTTYDDNTPIPAGVVVTYDLEHRYCGDTAWIVVAPALASPSAPRPLGPVCHEYAYVAIAEGVRSLESPVLKIDLTPPPPKKTPHAPSLPQSQ